MSGYIPHCGVASAILASVCNDFSEVTFQVQGSPLRTAGPHPECSLCPSTQKQSSFLLEGLCVLEGNRCKPLSHCWPFLSLWVPEAVADKAASVLLFPKRAGLPWDHCSPHGCVSSV